jgi:hypothetical protein
MKIVILTYESYQSFKIVSGLVKKFPKQVVGIIQSSTHISGKNTLQSIFYLMRYTGIKFWVLKGLEIFISKIANFNHGFLNADKIRRMLDLCNNFKIEHQFSKNVNSNAIFQKIKKWNPDLIVSVYFNQKIGRKLINEYTVINIHPSYLPRHRGLFPYFWSLVENDPYTGVSIHIVDENFDTCPLIAQHKIQIK